MARTFLEGNEAIARGAIAAGCRFYAGYPITPATSIYHQMLQFLPSLGGVCMQGEDEIASIGFCLGASMGGSKGNDRDFRSGDQFIQRADLLCHRRRNPVWLSSMSSGWGLRPALPPKERTEIFSFFAGATAADCR